MRHALMGLQFALGRECFAANIAPKLRMHCAIMFLQLDLTIESCPTGLARVLMLKHCLLLLADREKTTGGQERCYQSLHFPGELAGKLLQLWMHLEIMRFKLIFFAKGFTAMHACILRMYHTIMSLQLYLTIEMSATLITPILILRHRVFSFGLFFKHEQIRVIC